MVLPHPSDTPGVPKHLGDPRECVIRHDSWRREGWQKLQNNQVAGGRRIALESRSTLSLSQVHPNCIRHFICPGEDGVTGMKVSLRDGLDSPTPSFMHLKLL